MRLKRVCASLVLVLAAASAFADLEVPKMDSIYRFRGIKIPMNLKIKDVIVESGTFDLEFLKAADSEDLYLKLFKKGDVLDVIKGEEWAYSNTEAVSGKPTLKMARDTGNNTLILTFESGKDHRIFPLIRAKFSIPYSE
ncbi:MAG: hypothetical protein NTZ26_10890 [Candidatus Aminicenantes bacterium]|nr:hypothetical protein [Candidatus Aminicenantes bacterium]